MSKLFKKLLVALVGTISILSLSTTFAAEEAAPTLWDALLGENANWISSITTTWVTATSFTIEFPVYVSNGEQILNYAVSYVQNKPMSAADITDYKKVAFEGSDVVITNNKVAITLDELTPNTTYNFVVNPINKDGIELEFSDEFSVKTPAANGWSTTNTTDPVNTTTNWGDDQPMLWSADTAGANFTYEVNKNAVTVKWNAISGALKFQFSMKEATAAQYTYLWDADISAESYNFLVWKTGLFTVKVVPVDGAWNPAWVERTLSIKIDDLSPPTGTGTPPTWAGLNLILMSTFLMMLMYVVYRFRTTK